MTGNAADAIGPVTPDTDVFVLSAGNFSLIDVIEHCINHVGPCHIDLATWTAADADLRRAEFMARSNHIKSMRLIVDPSFKSRQPRYCSTLIELFGNDAIRTVPTHAKFCVIRGAFPVVIRTSMNLNSNRRIESVEIASDQALADFLTSFVDECYAVSPEMNFNDGQRLSRPAVTSGLSF